MSGKKKMYPLGPESRDGTVVVTRNLRRHTAYGRNCTVNLVEHGVTDLEELNPTPCINMRLKGLPRYFFSFRFWDSIDW